MLDKNFVLQLACRDTDINEYLLSLYNIVVQDKYKTIVELGAGQSTFVLTAAVNETLGEFYSHDISILAIERLFPEGKGLLNNEPRFHFVEGDDLITVKQWDKPIDFLFLDTSHTFEQTKKEIDIWFPFVRSGGKIAMHDTAQLDPIARGCRIALDRFLESEEGEKYRAIHLLDTKFLGMSILIKL